MRGFLAEPRAPGNEATWKIVKAKFLEEDRNSVQEAAAAARMESVTEPGEGSGPTWRSEGDFNPQVAFEVINPCNALSGAGSDVLRFLHLQSITRTQFGQEHFGAGIEAFLRRIVHEPDAFPPEFLGAVCAVKPHGPGGEMPPGLCLDDMEAPYCCRDYEIVETAYEEAQSRSKAVWGWGVGMGGACSVTRHNTP